MRELTGQTFCWLLRWLLKKPSLQPRKVVTWETTYFIRCAMLKTQCFGDLKGHPEPPQVLFPPHIHSSNADSLWTSYPVLAFP